MSEKDKHEEEHLLAKDGNQPSKKKSPVNIHANHRERIRERFVKNGFDSLEDHVKLELLLFYALPRVDTNAIAHGLLNRFETLPNIFDASIDELTSVEGIGLNAAILIKLIPQLARTYMDASSKMKKGFRFHDNDSIAEYLQNKYIGRRVETLTVIALDSKNRLLFFEVINEGSIDTVPIYIRRIVEVAVRPDVASIILAHNHPSGNTMFSREDFVATREVFRALNAIGVELMDHFLLVDGDYASMRTVGLFDQILEE